MIRDESPPLSIYKYILMDDGISSYLLVLKRLGERLTNHHENWYLLVLLHGKGS